jgi:hypothetical protein
MMGPTKMPPPPNSLLLRVCFFAFLQFFVGGLIVAAGVFAVSLFETGSHAEYTRIVSLGPLLALSAVGLVRALWIFVASRLNQ